MARTPRNGLLDPSQSDDDGELARLLASYIDRLNAEEKIDPEEVFEKHPDFAADILRELETFEEVSTEEAPPQPLGTLGDYDLLREIGRGGMGIVYEAWQSSMDRRVALKVLPMGFAADAKSLTRFVREAKTAAKLSHPNLVAVYAMGVEAETPYFAMEYVEGETLAELLQRIRDPSSGETSASAVRSLARRFEKSSASGKESGGSSHREPESGDRHGTPHHRGRRTTETSVLTADYFRGVAEAFAEIADGLHHAHSHRVVHRDIKPSNLILDAEAAREHRGAGHVRVLDFGLARLEGQETLTGSGDVMGTPLYMSPEQARAKKGRIDHRTDLYSLGATLYEMVTLGPPFKGKSHQDTVSQILSRDPKRPRDLTPQLPRDLETIILKCLQKDPGDRYPSAEALALDLRRFEKGEPIEARPQPVLEKMGRRVWQNRGRLVVATFVLLFLALLGFLVHRRWVESQEAMARDYKRLVLEGAAKDQAFYPSTFWRPPRSVAILEGTVGAPAGLGSAGRGELGALDESALGEGIRAARRGSGEPAGRGAGSGGGPTASDETGSPGEPLETSDVFGEGGEPQESEPGTSAGAGTAPGAGFSPGLPGDFIPSEETRGRRRIAHAAAEVPEETALPRQLQDAMRRLHAAIELFPGRPEAHYHLAQCLKRLGRETEAREALEQSLRCEPPFLPAVLLEASWGKLPEEELEARVSETLAAGKGPARVWAKAWHQAHRANEEGRSREALEALDELLELERAGFELPLGFSIATRLLRGRVRLEVHEENTALEDFIVARDTWPELPEPVLLAARVRWRKGEREFVEERFIEFHTKTRRPDDQDAFAFQVAEFYKEQGELQKALDWVENRARRSCLREVHRSWILRLDGKTDEALRVAQEAVELDGTNPLAHVAKAMACSKLSRFQDAELAGRQAFDLAHDDYLVVESLGHVYLDQRRFSDAIPHLEKARDLAPKRALAHQKLGVAYLGLGRLNAAVQALERATELAPTSVDACKGLARALECEEKYTEAIETLRRGIAACEKATPPEKERAALLHVRLAESLRKEGNTEAAAEEIHLATELQTKSAAVLTRIGLELHYLDRSGEAIQILGDAIDADSGYASAHNALGIVHAAEGRTKDAIEAYSAAFAHDPTFAGAHHNLGNLLMTLGRPQQALREYEKAIGILPADASPWAGKGSVLAAQGDFEEAIEAFDRAAELDPFLEWPRNATGNLLRRLGRTAEAITAFEAAARASPRSPIPHVNIGDLWLEDERNYAKARKAYESARERDGRSLRVHIKLGEVHRLRALELAATDERGRERELDLARDAFEEARKLEPESPEPPYRLARLLLARGEPEKALSTFGDAEGLNWEKPQTHIIHGRLLERVGRPGKARKAYVKALQLDPDDSVAHARLASIFIDDGLTDEAERHYREVLSADPLDAATHANLGAAVVRWQGIGKALPHFRRSLALVPGDPDFCTFVGGWLRSEDKLDEAEDVFRTLSEQRPDHPAGPRELARILGMRGKYREASAKIAEAISRKWDDASSHWVLIDGLSAAEHLEFGDELSSIAKALGQGVERSPDPPRSVPWALAFVLSHNSRSRDAAAAVRYAKRAFDRVPNKDALTYGVLAEVCYRAGRIEEASEKMEEATRLPGVTQEHRDKLKAYRSAALPDLPSYGTVDAVLSTLGKPARWYPESIRIPRALRVLEVAGGNDLDSRQEESAPAALARAGVWPDPGWAPGIVVARPKKPSPSPSAEAQGRPVVFGTPPPGAEPIFTQGWDFEDSEAFAPIEWSHRERATTPRGQRKFLGEFGNDDVTLRIDFLPEHACVRVSFDLLVIRTWDGNKTKTGPDIWSLEVQEGPTLLRTTFQHHLLDGFQAFPDSLGQGEHPGVTGAAEVGTLGYPWNDYTECDAVYRLSFTFPHTLESLRLAFSASGLEPIKNESWGLDNVQVELYDSCRTASPEELRRLWEGLAHQDPLKANEALWGFISAGQAGPRFVEEKLLEYVVSPGKLLAPLEKQRILEFSRGARTEAAKRRFEYLLARLLELRGNHREAALRLESLLAKDPLHPEPYMRIVENLSAAGDAAGAQRWLDRAVESGFATSKELWVSWFLASAQTGGLGPEALLAKLPARGALRFDPEDRIRGSLETLVTHGVRAIPVEVLRRIARARGFGPLQGLAAEVVYPGIWSQLEAAVSEENTAGTRSVGGSTGSWFRDVPEGGGLLVGFDLSIAISRDTGRIVKTLQPMFLTRNGIVAGRQHGNPLEGCRTYSIRADPGYAVGAIEAAGNSRLSGLQATFMKIRRDAQGGAWGLDPRDTKKSLWYGSDLCAERVELRGDGSLVLGINGRHGGDVDAVGLVLERERQRPDYAAIDVAVEKRPDRTTTLAPDEAAWRFLVAPSAPTGDLEWTGPDFDDSSWTEASGPHEWESEVRPGSKVYVRHAFEVEDPMSLRRPRLLVAGAERRPEAAYINGVEVARTEAGRDDLTHGIALELGALRKGRNLLAVELRAAGSIRGGSSLGLTVEAEAHPHWDETLRLHRALRALEIVGSSEARSMIERLAGEEPVSPQGPDFSAALARLETRSLPDSAPAGSAEVKPIRVHFSDFEEEVGPEWSADPMDTTPVGARKFLGQFGSEAVKLSLEELPEHRSIRISFDLFVIRSWDGIGEARGGLDAWTLTREDGRALVATSFATGFMHDTAQAFPDALGEGQHPIDTGATETETLGYEFAGRKCDAVYSMSATFPHSSSDLTLVFAGIGLQEISDESWGLDNVVVEALPHSVSLETPEKQHLWDDLASLDPMRANEALWKIVAAGDEGVAYLKERLEATGAERDRMRLALVDAKRAAWARYRAGLEDQGAGAVATYFDARLLQGRGDHRGALKKLRQVLATDRSRPEPFLRAGESLAALGQASAAEAFFLEPIRRGLASSEDAWARWLVVAARGRKLRPEEILVKVPRPDRTGVEDPKRSGVSKPASDSEGPSGPEAVLRWSLELLAAGDLSEIPGEVLRRIEASGNLGALESFAVDTAFPGTWKAIRDAVEHRLTERSERGGESGHVGFEQVPAPGAILVGLDLTVGYWRGAPTVTSARLVFLGDSGRIEGEILGKQNGRSIKLRARPGYAVGGVVLTKRFGVRRLKLLFQRIAGARLDVSDAYESEWIGDDEILECVTLGGFGEPVVGVFGNAGGSVSRLGLVLAHPRLTDYRSVELALNARETLVAPDADWRFLRGREEPSEKELEWAQPDFDDSSWEHGPGPFGYGAENLGSVLDDMRGNCTTLYLRHEFELEDPERIRALYLDLRVDDGCVVYLNGQEATRLRSGEIEDVVSVAATADNESRGLYFREDLEIVRRVLRKGRNVLAVQALNSALDDPDFLLSAAVRAEVHPQWDEVVRLRRIERALEVVGSDAARSVLEDLSGEGPWIPGAPDFGAALDRIASRSEGASPQDPAAPDSEAAATGKDETYFFYSFEPDPLAEDFDREDDNGAEVEADDAGEEDEDVVGPEWSRRVTEVTPVGERRFLGRFGNERVTLSLTGLSEHAAIRLSFNLLVIRSWDGDTDQLPKTATGQDVWSVAIAEGPTLLRTNFLNPLSVEFLGNTAFLGRTQAFPDPVGLGHHAAYTGAAEKHGLGYVFGKSSEAMDARYQLSFVCPHTSGDLRVEFSASGLERIDNESWGLDDVEVELLPECVPLEIAERGSLWDDLTSQDPTEANEALWKLIGAGDEGVAYLKERLEETQSERERQRQKGIAFDWKRFDALREEARRRTAPDLVAYLDGLLYERCGEPEKAVERFSEAVKADASSGAFRPEALLRLTRNLQSLGRAEEAEERLEAAIRLGGEFPGEFWDLWFAIAAGDLRKSPEALLAVLPQMPAQGATEHTDDIRWALETLRDEGILRMNCGGNDYMAADGALWRSDRFCLGRNKALHSERDVECTSNEGLYRSEAFFWANESPLPGYRIPLPRARYRVTLHFAEIYHTEPGKRLFDVLLEGRKVLRDYEPKIDVAEVLPFDVEVADGHLDIQFVSHVNAGKLSGISIERLPASPAPQELSANR